MQRVWSPVFKDGDAGAKWQEFESVKVWWELLLRLPPRPTVLRGGCPMPRLFCMTPVKRGSA